MTTKIFTSGMLTTAIVLASACGVRAQKGMVDWPKVINNPSAKIVVYQPQLESFTDDHLAARAAVSVTQPKKDAVFGAVWFDAQVAVDRSTRIVTLLETKVTEAKFPNATADQIASLESIIEKEIPNWGTQLSYDELVALLQVAHTAEAESEKLNNTPPEIIFRTTPSVLVTIDGDPIVKDVPNSKLKSVVNTPFFIVQEPSSQVWYLKGSEAWYSAKAALGPWSTLAQSPPQDVVSLAEQAVSKPPADADKTTAPQTPASPVIPAIVVRTKPAELIQCDGEPKYDPIDGTQLLYVDNTESDIIMDIASQRYFVLIAGRWYASKSLTDGPWAHVAGDQLPTDFPKIPTDSEMADVRPSVPGTPEAKEAVLENSIPTTAQVDRKTATVTVTYDGDPKFEKIEGTSMSYAVNTDKSVLLIGGTYYCCDNAVWFESSNAKGPWTVSTAVPKDVQSIPPDSPVYNVKYVYIYDSTPDVVVVGYTPAYCGSYVYGGCVVYGTGFYYAPWYGAYYYPRPCTYGFAVHYNPWTGWGFAFGMSYGWFHVSVGYYGHGGYWGPAGYAHGYNHGYYQGYNRGYAAGYYAGKGAGARPTPYSNNVYKNRPSTGVTSNARPSTQPAKTRPSSAGARTSTPNNVYADKNGNVYRNQGGDWQQRSNGGWSGDTSRPSGQPGGGNLNTSDLDSQFQARQRSSQRMQDYSGSMSRPSGFGGGGRRR